MGTGMKNTNYPHTGELGSHYFILMPPTQPVSRVVAYNICSSICPTIQEQCLPLFLIFSFISVTVAKIAFSYEKSLRNFLQNKLLQPTETAKNLLIQRRSQFLISLKGFLPIFLIITTVLNFLRV